jgi:nucleoid-associated protein YgaU
MARSVYERFGQTALVGTASTARRYTVRGDDTMFSIQAKFLPDEGYSSEAWRQFAEYNGIDDLDALAAGNVLTIPTLQPLTT